MSQILITGAAGFLGSAVVRQLKEHKASIRCTGRSRRQDHLPNYRPADLCETTDYNDLLNDVSCIVHCAGLAHQFQSRPPRDSLFQNINCEATAQLARAAANRGVRRFVFVSSVSVYGPSKEDSLRSEDALPAPQGPYAKSKRNAEIRLLRIASETGMQVLILRMATLYGENDPGNLGRLLDAIKQGRFVMIGSGKNQKSLLYRDDAARACAEAALIPTDRLAGIWNVSAEPASMKRIVEEISRAVHRPPPRRSVPANLATGLLWTASAFGIGPVRPWARSRFETVKKWRSHDAYDGSRFSRDFAWERQISIEEGFQRMAQGQTESAPPAKTITPAA